MRTTPCWLSSRLAVAVAFAAACTGGGSVPPPSPVGFSVPQTPPGDDERVPDPKIAKVRVYAGQAYRSQTVRWRQDIAERLDMASQILVPLFGIRLEAVEIRKWEHKGPANNLQDMVEELEALDDGDDVHWVIGMVTALPYATGSVHELGMARPLGRHIVLRGFDAARDDKAARRTEAARRHKQTLVLLHEIAHTLGALHVRKTEWIMNPAYAPEQASFAPQNKDVMQLVLAERMTDPPADTLAREARALLAYLKMNEWGGWEPEERASTIEWLEENRVDEMAPAGDDDAAGKGQKVPPEVVAQFERVQALLGRKRFGDARTELAQLIEAYPANVEIRLAACALEIGEHGPEAEKAREVCGVIGEVAPGRLDGDLMIGGALMRSGAEAEGIKVLAGARARLETMGDEAPQASWQALATIFRSIGAVTWAEDAASRVDGDEARSEVATWARATRSRFGVPPDGKRFGITPASEPAYTSAVGEVLTATYNKDYARARKLAQQALRTFPNAPGILSAMCDLDYRQRKYGSAMSRCQRAIAGYAEVSWPQYLVGILEARKRRYKAAIRHFEKAIEVDPELSQAYRALAQVYERTDDTAALQALRQRYQTRFGQPLP